ncbi:unnamed protein product [Brachionus calyciflorus]|uniref:Ig-like domain-containing protein n=1 Tax=Brachionus calyciflorus TaxID=104777 RepID=A0A813N6H0_9BILA|nr:unnamed protein product [Brachionus calyciflorus]
MFLTLFWIFILSLNNLNAQVNNSVLSNNSPKLLRSINKNIGINSQPRIQFELYKALLGETVRLECPQPNPTWFFRHISSDDTSTNNNVENIIVTRHGIINSDYKYKIMCHMTLKHKVIIINNIDFDEEGLYTCLYTIPSDQSSKVGQLNADSTTNPIQFRYVFNVTVYTLLNGVKMNYQSSNPSALISQANQFNVKKNENQFELVENTISLKENDELVLQCIVESSKPAADIKFTIKTETNQNHRDEMPSLNNNHFSSFLTLPPLTQPPKLASLQSEETNIIKNSDSTFKTIHTVRLKANRLDHSKTISCFAENGFSNQKWETKKSLSILYAPVCKDPNNFIYYVGINQTVNIECRILNANPSQITYEWNLDNIKKFSEFRKSEHYELSYNSNDFMTQRKDSLLLGSSFNLNKNMIHFQNEEFTSRFKWKPTDLEQFGEISCKASNDIGTTECKYEIKLGGIPNPPTECTYTLKNSSAIISCIVGYHQGDPDIYCYLLKKSENGVYKEHTRNRESCSFIVNDVNVNKHNEFWIYSSNKFGHNKDMGFHLSIGQAARATEPENNKNMILIGIVTALFVFCIAACCFCFRVKKGLTDDNESISDSDPYHAKSNPNGVKGKQVHNSVKIIKGMKVLNSNNYNDDEYSNKYLKIDLNHENYLEKSNNSYLQVAKNEDYDDKKKILMYQDRKASLTLHKKKPRTDESNIKKSISFLNELNHDCLNDETKLLKESTPFFKKDENLLTTVNDQNSSLKNSLSSLNEQTLNSNKMITFQSTKKNFENHTNTTVSTSVSTSSTGSTSSPIPYSSNGSDTTEQISNNKLTVSDQCFNIQTSLFLQNQNLNRLSTFSDTSSKLYRSPRRFVDSQDGSYNVSPKQENSLINSQEYGAKLSDSFEAKYLNKLCEEIEVSLNVDCECADDYSVNDFSGDYSFDNCNSKNQIYSTIPAVNRQLNASTPNPSHSLHETIKNLEQIKKNKNTNVKNGLVSFSQNSSSTDSQNSKNLGVLV